MIIKGANAAITRDGSCTILDLRELMHLMTRRERLTLIALAERYNATEKSEDIARVTRQNLVSREKRRSGLAAARYGQPARPPREG